jgi:hypothetical protein
MSEASKAKVNVDQTPINKGGVECDACIDFNSLDQPETITVFIRGLDATQIVIVVGSVAKTHRHEPTPGSGC